MNKKQLLLQRDWERVLAAHSRPLERGAKSMGTTAKFQPRERLSASVDPARDLRRWPSLNTGEVPASARPQMQYTGDKMLGVSVLHKSNSIPVFSTQEILDISKMRR